MTEEEKKSELKCMSNLFKEVEQAMRTQQNLNDTLNKWAPICKKIFGDIKISYKHKGAKEWVYSEASEEQSIQSQEQATRQNSPTAIQLSLPFKTTCIKKNLCKTRTSGK